jgi:hypothetical protein
LVHPLGTESLAHRAARRLATGIHADRCQAERPAVPIDWDDRLSLAAKSNRSYLIAPASGLCGYGGHK